jgi:hypothetical protein
LHQFAARQECGELRRKIVHDKPAGHFDLDDLPGASAFPA